MPGAPQDLALPDEQPQATFALSPPQHTITLLIGCVLYAESSTLINLLDSSLSWRRSLGNPDQSRQRVGTEIKTLQHIGVVNPP